MNKLQKIKMNLNWKIGLWIRRSWAPGGLGALGGHWGGCGARWGQWGGCRAGWGYQGPLGMGRIVCEWV